MTQTEKTELAKAMKNCEFKVMDLLLFAMTLSEILEDYKETPSPGGGRPIRRVDCLWDEAAMRIADVQMSAKYVIDNLLHLTTELDFYINQPTE